VSLLAQVEPVRAVLERPHGLLEGPRLREGGEMVYSDVIAGGVFACAPDGAIRTLLAARRGVGGIVPHADGGVVLSGRTVLHLRPDGSQHELLADGDGVCGYNDLGTTARGELLAGALCYRPFAGEEPRPGRLLELSSDGSVRVLSEELQWPNGIAETADAGAVLVSDYARGHVLRVERGDGAAEVFARAPEGSPDGLALDAEGGAWVALGEAGAIARFDADGGLQGVQRLPATFVSSISFGGADMCDVLVTTADNAERPELGGTLLRARSEVPGLAVTPVSV
jgi:sugar lactone lactonase YvrE